MKSNKEVLKWNFINRDGQDNNFRSNKTQTLNSDKNQKTADFEILGNFKNPKFEPILKPKRADIKILGNLKKFKLWTVIINTRKKQRIFW